MKTSSTNQLQLVFILHIK